METIWKQAEALKPELIARRRDLHTHLFSLCTGYTGFFSLHRRLLSYEQHELTVSKGKRIGLDEQYRPVFRSLYL